MAEPLTFAEAAAHLRLGDDTSEQSQVERLIIAAREWVENYTGLVLTRRQVTETLDVFAGSTKLRAWPVDTEQPVSIAYRDTADTAQVISNAVLQAAARPAMLYPAAGSRWPLNATVSGKIYVTFTAGYPDAAAIPKVLQLAMMVMLTAFYEDREGGELFAAAESSARRLCRRHKRLTL